MVAMEQQPSRISNVLALHKESYSCLFSCTASAAALRILFVPINRPSVESIAREEREQEVKHPLQDQNNEGNQEELHVILQLFDSSLFL